MRPGIRSLKTLYWKSRERIPRWLEAHRPAELRRQLQLRIEAWREPVVEIGGIRVYRSPFYTLQILESLASGAYELPEATIMRHALTPDDMVLELGTGLGYLSALCAQTVGNERVHTFEANPALEPVIRKNHELNAVAPRLNIRMLGEVGGAITFYVMKSFWSSSTIKRHPRAKPIQVPVEPFNEAVANIRPSFLVVDIEGGEQDLFRYARLDGVEKLCIELHPGVIGQRAVDDVVAAIARQGLEEDVTVSGPEHKLFVRFRPTAETV